MLSITIEKDNITIEGNMTQEEVKTLESLKNVIDELCGNHNCKEGAE